MSVERPTDPVAAIRDAVPTSRHARMLFDMVVQRLGDACVVESAGGGAQFTVFHRDAAGSPWIVPWPLLQLGVAGRLSVVIGIVGPAEGPPRPGRAPRLRGLGPGEIVLHDGPESVTVTYGDDGRWFETTVSQDPTAFDDVVPALAAKDAGPVELLAEHVAALRPGRHGPGRVLCPEPVPAVAAPWHCGLYALRDALFDGRIPPDAEWAVADGYEGKAIAWGASQEAALDSWRAEVSRAPPTPPKAAEAPTRLGMEEVVGPEGPALRIRGASADGSWPEAAPAVVIALARARRALPPWASVRLLGGRGGTGHALLRRDADGFTLVGRDLVGRIDLDALDVLLEGVGPFDHPLIDEAREAWRGTPPKHPCLTIVCRVLDEDTLVPVAPAFVESQRSDGFRGRMLDADRLRLRVVRQRWLA